MNKHKNGGNIKSFVAIYDMKHQNFKDAICDVNMKYEIFIWNNKMKYTKLKFNYATLDIKHKILYKHVTWYFTHVLDDIKHETWMLNMKQALM